ncbi:MAG: hypothetical protein IT508_10740 [Burkholderiaceae bacterium]|nr:hypothetical protein [Burkholderiaceae bacterium]
MPYTTAGRNALLTSGKGGVTHVGAVTDIAGTEVAGGSYARQAVTWGAAASGAATNTGALTIPIPAGSTPVALAYYDALSAGNLLGVFPYGSAGQVLDGVATVTAADTFTSNVHGLAADDRVFVAAVAGETLPAGLSATTLYYVRATGLTSDTFTLATTSGGSAVDVTAAGELVWFKTVPNTFASAGNLTVAIAAASIDLTFA